MLSRYAVNPGKLGISKGFGRSIGTLMLSVLAAFPAVAAEAASAPGKGVEVQPIDFGNQNTQFQTEIVRLGLEALGYEVKASHEADVPIAHMAVAQGEADYMAVHWVPLHETYYERSGGDALSTRLGSLVSNADQGILIDKKTADAQGITSLDQLKDPKIAALFDMDGDGKADLTGCNPGWGCERLIEEQLDRLDLHETVTHRQGVYNALIADTVTQYRAGRPILYFTWTPMWVSSILVPGKDVTWLKIPQDENVETEVSDRGFAVNTVKIMANNEFLEDNPAAKKFFELVTIDINDINAENALIVAGEKSPEDILNHANQWIADNKALFDQWISEARMAAEQ